MTMSRGRFSGRLRHSVDVPHTTAGLNMQTSLEEFGRSLPYGITQASPKTREYRQQDHRTCFYAALIAIHQGHGLGATPPERLVAAEAMSERLLGPHGAETGYENYERQADFVGRVLGLQIEFISQQYDEQRIDALTSGIADGGQPVIFGVKQHWLVLDGFKRTQNSVAWIGMNPGPGRRLEQTGGELGPAFLAARLVDSGLPLVRVVVPSHPRARFRPASPDVARFRPAK